MLIKVSFLRIKMAKSDWWKEGVQLPSCIIDSLTELELPPSVENTALISVPVDLSDDLPIK